MFDEAEFQDDELKLGDEEDRKCTTEKDKYESLQRNGGCLIATSHCGVVYQVRELWRSEGKQQARNMRHACFYSSYLRI